jgi:hypothetical protein
MAYVIDPANKRIILDVADATAQSIYRAWVDWLVLGDNSKYLPAFRSTGGDDLGGGISIPAYYFLTNGWYVRPMESDHTLTVTGNLFVDGGGDPIVHTIGTFNVLVKSVVPVQAQTVTISGSGGLTTPQATMLLEMYNLLGLDPATPLVVTNTARTAGTINQTIDTNASQTTVTRV